MPIVQCRPCGQVYVLAEDGLPVCPRCASAACTPLPMAAPGAAPLGAPLPPAAVQRPSRGVSVLALAIGIGVLTVSVAGCLGVWSLWNGTSGPAAALADEFEAQLAPPYEISAFYSIRHPRMLSDIDYRNQDDQGAGELRAVQFTGYGDADPIPVLTITMGTLPEGVSLQGPASDLAVGGMQGLQNARAMQNVTQSQPYLWEGQGYQYWRIDFSADVAGERLHGFILGALEYNRTVQIYVLCRQPPGSAEYRLYEGSASTFARQ